jgi:hypothetical protein
MKGVHERDSLPRIIIAMSTVQIGVSDETVLLCVDGDGRLGWEPLSLLTVDWRYDPKTELWSDPTTGSVHDDDDEF